MWLYIACKSGCLKTQRVNLVPSVLSLPRGPWERGCGSLYNALRLSMREKFHSEEFLLYSQAPQAQNTWCMRQLMEE